MESDSYVDFNNGDYELPVLCCTPPHTDYKDSNHAEKVLRLLEKDTGFCDVFIEAEGERFKVHKTLFGVYSDFFQKAFNAEMREKYDNVVKLEGVSAEVMKSIVGFFYSGKIEICSENAFEMLTAADYLMIDAIKQFSVSSLINNVDAKSCFATWFCGKKYELPELMEKSADFIGNHLDLALEAEEAQNLSTDEFEEIMATGKMFRQSEEVTYENVLAWIEENRDGRKEMFPAMFSNLDISQLSTEFLEETVLHQPLVSQSVQLMMIVATELVRRRKELKADKDDLTKKLNAAIKQLTEKSNQLRIREQFLLGVDEKANIYKFRIQTGKWEKMPKSGIEVEHGPDESLTYAGLFKGEHLLKKRDLSGEKFGNSISCNDVCKSSCELKLTRMDGITYAIETGRILVRGLVKIARLAKVPDSCKMKCDDGNSSSSYTPNVFRHDEIRDQWVKVSVDNQRVWDYKIFELVKNSSTE